MQCLVFVKMCFFFFSTETKYWVLLSNIRHAGILLNFERDVTLFGQFVGMTLPKPRYRVTITVVFATTALVMKMKLNT